MFNSFCRWTIPQISSDYQRHWCFHWVISHNDARPGTVMSWKEHGPDKTGLSSWVLQSWVWWFCKGHPPQSPISSSAKWGNDILPPQGSYEEQGSRKPSVKSGTEQMQIISWRLSKRNYSKWSRDGLFPQGSTLRFSAKLEERRDPTYIWGPFPFSPISDHGIRWPTVIFSSEFSIQGNTWIEMTSPKSPLFAPGVSLLVKANPRLYGF